MLPETRLVLVDRLLLQLFLILGQQVGLDLVEVLHTDTRASSAVNISAGVMSSAGH
jgi:hypothetical protein